MPVQMKRFYLAVSLEYEDSVLRKMGELGTSQILTEIPVTNRASGEKTETCKKLGPYERIKILLKDIPNGKQTENAQGASKMLTTITSKSSQTRQKLS